MTLPNLDCANSECLFELIQNTALLIGHLDHHSVETWGDMGLINVAGTYDDRVKQFSFAIQFFDSRCSSMPSLRKSGARLSSVPRIAKISPLKISLARLPLLR